MDFFGGLLFHTNWMNVHVYTLYMYVDHDILVNSDRLCAKFTLDKAFPL